MIRAFGLPQVPPGRIVCGGVKKFLLLVSLLLVSPLVAAPNAVDEILASFQTKAEAGEDIGELLPLIENLPSPDQKRLIGEIEKLWPRLRDGYLADLKLAAGAQSGKKGDTRQEIAKQRAAFREVYGKDEATMKPLLKSVSMPAVEALRKLLSPDPAQLMAAGGEKLKANRKLVRALAELRDGALKVTISTTPMDSISSLEAGEQATAEAICGFDRADLKTLAQNRKLAKDQEIPEAEAKGIEECNELRMLVGVRALVLDPKLCEAARDHSKDMQEKGFFAHESPVPGKKTPWERAKNFGTSASGENIYMGSSDPHGANMGWFYSPGHHKNMFNAGQVRIGLGCTGSHWTQMFGG
jgi:uncharacterized protein YkwD